MQIKLDTKLGAVALAISAEAGDAVLGKLAMQQVVFHVAASKAFKKGSGFSREDAFSPMLQAHVESVVQAELLAAGFGKPEVKGSQYVKADPAEAIIRSMEKIGIKDARAVLAAARKAEAPTTTTTDDESVG